MAGVWLPVLGACSIAGASETSLTPPPGATDGSSFATTSDPLALLEDRDPTLAANKRLVFDMWRKIVNAGRVELADEMLREDYIQHSPVLPSGRAGFKQVFAAAPRSEIPSVVSPPLLTILAEGERVVMALREDWQEPNSAGRYATTHFNLFRVEDGRLAEHWHSVQQAPDASVPPPERGGLQPVMGASGAALQALLRANDPVLEANKRLVFDAWQRHASNHHSYDLVDHDPTKPTGGPAFPSRDAPLVALVAQGDVVVLVTALEHPHPARAGATYTTTWFDMFRINGGRLAEHWNGAIKPGTHLPIYGVAGPAEESDR